MKIPGIHILRILLFLGSLLLWIIAIVLVW